MIIEVGNRRKFIFNSQTSPSELYTAVGKVYSGQFCTVMEVKQKPKSGRHLIRVCFGDGVDFSVNQDELHEIPYSLLPPDFTNSLDQE